MAWSLGMAEEDDWVKFIATGLIPTNTEDAVEGSHSTPLEAPHVDTSAHSVTRTVNEGSASSTTINSSTLL